MARYSNCLVGENGKPDHSKPNVDIIMPCVLIVYQYPLNERIKPGLYSKLIRDIAHLHGLNLQLKAERKKAEALYRDTRNFIRQIWMLVEPDHPAIDRYGPHLEPRRSEARIRVALMNMYGDAVCMANEAEKGVQQKWEGYEVDKSNLDRLVAEIDFTIRSFDLNIMRRKGTA